MGIKANIPECITGSSLQAEIGSGTGVIITYIDKAAASIGCPLGSICLGIVAP
ncbi:uncharacterized protein METZ01_LOCUS21951 [marine metagenome]|uniref:Uncharacterized protein n=1 Tax=marine metagenome TaxID=408172 RepID=A0A381PSQ1_9ZZZZ